LSIDLGQFERDGFLITKPLFSPAEVDRFIQQLSQAENRGHRRGGLRDVLDALPELRNLANHSAIRTIVDQILGLSAFVVRATLFDKTACSNWKVPWHQDVTIAVAERHETPGYSPWSIKVGVLHVQPPSEILEQMLTVRIHLDDCPATNGALRVIPGTHLLGKLNQNHVDQCVDELRAATCEASRGAALIMRPLLLHASSVATHPGHRRVLHFDFANNDLATGLQWRMRTDAPVHLEPVDR
jgi:ectoine hydroxylase-related dioxygenase (phytanoyl-CoA dioxygenase family)